MEDILDSLRRIVSRWVETKTPITDSIAIGDTVISVYSSNRFNIGDEVMIEGPIEGEPNLVIEEIIDNTHIRLATPVYNTWDIGEAMILRKLTNGMFIEGIYIGDPEVIPKYPAITINGTTIDSSFITLDSTKETYNVDLTVYVEESTYEDGYRFLMKITNLIRTGLKRNIYPLINDYDLTAITANVSSGDIFVKIADSSIFNTELTDTNSAYPRFSDARLILEDRFDSTENRVENIIDETTIELYIAACRDYDIEYNPIAINPHRFVFNSWPKSIRVGKAAKQGKLLQASVISWFAEEQVVEHTETKRDPHLK